MLLTNKELTLCTVIAKSWRCSRRA